ncbi:MAG: response regulator transcription factor [Clostridia bacterium]|nr:response regulator transcription factor [Clostridia bacterium]
MTTILLVEDDATLREGLTELFTRDGYQVITAGSVREAKEKLTGEIQGMVMDVGLPDGDGVSLCREWRAAGETRPVLFLTARGEEFDVVRGLDSGGNDYVTKPFRMQELLSRVRVMLRNTQAARPVSRGGYTVDRERMQVLKDGEALPLTLTEYKILTMLMDRPNVVPRERLLEVLWDDGGKFIDDNTLSVHMSRLREKVGAEHVRTIRGVGYQWSDTSSSESSC